MEAWDSASGLLATGVLLVSNSVCCFSTLFFSFHFAYCLQVLGELELAFYVLFLGLVLHVMTFGM